MKPGIGAALVLGCLMAAAMGLRAQASNSGKAPDANRKNSSDQDNPAANSKSAPAQTPSRVQTQTNANPFPEDTSTVPVIPTNASPDSLPGLSDESSRLPAPPDDLDPVRTPEDAGEAAESNEKTSSSSLSGLGDLLPGPDDTAEPGKRHGKNADLEPDHHESAKEDEDVGNYYLDNKNWRGALSRFESALVLDPYNPEVYWGLAECQRHLGDFAGARTNYLKVTQYDPGSRHAKEARKALQDPEIANAKPQTPSQPPTQPQ